MKKPKLSYTGIADYMAATPSRQRKILSDFKYPDEDEPKARIIYYREARDLIISFHKGQKPNDWLTESAVKLADMASLEPPRSSRRVRLNNNARVLESYARHYSSTSLTVLDNFECALKIGNIEISVRPEIHAIEKKSEKIIKLDFSKDPHSDHYYKVSCQLLYESNKSKGLNLKPQQCLVRHIDSKTDFKRARTKARIYADIEATCQNIEAIWDSI